MNNGNMQYEYVSLDNEWMRLAYKLAKNLYFINKWNLKTTPVAIIVKNNRYITHGICADGAHPLQAKCDRLDTKGSSYETCEYCREDQHAERKALQEAYDKDLAGAIIYVYGHYKLCDSCIKALNERGIFSCVLLENSKILFDRHDPDTVLGTEKQFLI